MRTLIAASAAGSANVLSPVFRHLHSRPEMQPRVIAEKQALQVFREQGIPVEEVPQLSGTREDFLRALFQEEIPDTLLLGTCWGASVEKELLRIGGEHGLPSLSVVDHWSNYKERFLEPGSRKLQLPSRIGLMDTRALERAAAEGLPREILKVTGQPHLQSLASAVRDPLLRRQAEELQKRWLGGAEGPVFLFCSELFSDNRGYTAADALEGVAEALDLLGGRPPHLMVKPHPKESGDTFHAGPAARRRGFRVVQSEPAWHCLLAADVLIGMTSMLLMEAAVAGKPAISYQPAQGKAVPFIGIETGIVRGARTAQELAALMGAPPQAAAQPAFLREILSGDAAARIADLLLELRPSPEVRR